MRMSDIYEAAGIFSLPADPFAAADALGIKVIDYKTLMRITYEEKEKLYSEQSLGLSFLHLGKPCIAVNENACDKLRQRFTVAHELGHCVLGHVGKPLSKSEERSADCFAADFLAPTAVLSECGVRAPDEISRLCGITESAAEIRLEQLAGYEARRGAPTDEERRLISLFGDFIKKFLERRVVITFPKKR